MEERRYGNWRRGGYYDEDGVWHYHASGLGRVPYDGYAAVLHEGERVLTAAEARSYRQGGGGVQIVMNGTVIREQADIDRIADSLLSRLHSGQNGGGVRMGLTFSFLADGEELQLPVPPLPFGWGPGRTCGS